MRHARHHMDGVRVRGRVRDRRPKTHRSGMIRPMGGVRISGPVDRHDRPSMPPQRVRVDQRCRRFANRVREEFGWWVDVTMSCMQNRF